jgi:hypothetical protein
MRPPLYALAACVTVLAACSSSSSSSVSKVTTTIASTAPARPAAPPGPSASISGPITGGTGSAFVGAARTPDLNKAGYRESEFFAAGTARSYEMVGGERSTNGRWNVRPKDSAQYRTRILVRAPRDPSRFNGTVLVEWLNVSGGIDASADFTYMSTELLRSGYAWVGVSAQQIGVSGGTPVVPVPGLPAGGLRGIDPARYQSLRHPGDQYSLDIFTQIGRALRAPGRVDPLGGLRPERVAAIGESQSAFELTTYLDAIQATAHVYDGFFVHSRGGGAIPIEGGNIAAGISGGIHIRDDTDVPVLVFETETDLDFLQFYSARQPDTDHIRLWEVAGAAHADAYIVGDVAGSLGCAGEMNKAPTHYVVSAALRAFDTWMRTGTPPPKEPRLDVKVVNGGPKIQRDARGNALGGIRTPQLDVPVAAYSGAPADPSKLICLLFGSTHPFDADTLARLYPSKDKYVADFLAATDAAIGRGHLLQADRSAVLAEAENVKL